MDWTASFARRAHTLGSGEITAILALAGATDVITFSGGFPAPETFPVGVVTDIVADLLARDAAVALQYTATEGLASTRDYLAARLEAVQGLRPAPGELMITSGGIDCMELLAKSFIDPGDAVVVEAPSYLGAIMAFRGYQADVRGVPLDGGGLRVDVLADLLAGGLRPKVVYTIPDFQNPTGLSLSAERRHALVSLARRYGFLILEDVAYRDLGFGAPPPPALWSLAPDVVLQAGTCSKIFFPGVRLGWAAGPAQIISQLAIAKQNSDQCAGALGQRLFEEYGRGGHLDRQLAASRELYARRATLLTAALAAHLPEDSTWTVPEGGFYSWVTLPEGVDTVVLNSRATERKVAFVPGAPFYPVATPAGARQLRLSYSRVADDLIDEGVRRIAAAIAGMPPAAPAGVPGTASILIPETS
ncbi:MAG: PLP-dependent aminotransferase family protein [Streptosporangiaceae bacterium]|nr:PLP-dependent aminotransferase family protein [Streptosporangiaceae bacterium]MBV9857335.1 PLP-dependent aminotransferase family protein [Streptosporangiaceae bacterium]